MRETRVGTTVQATEAGDSYQGIVLEVAEKREKVGAIVEERPFRGA